MQKLKLYSSQPVSDKWNLVNDYADYEHSSASFYELGVVKNYKPFEFRFI